MEACQAPTKKSSACNSYEERSPRKLVEVVEVVMVCLVEERGKGGVGGGVSLLATLMS